MDHLRIWTQDAPDGYTEVVVEGDVGAFAWLIAAAGNARDGFLGNQADTTASVEGGRPARLVLQPLVPNAKADQALRSRTAHIRVDHRAAQEAAKIVVAQNDYEQIPATVLAELHHRGIRFATIVAAEPPAAETAPTPPPTQPTPAPTPSPGPPPAPEQPPAPPNPPTPQPAGDLTVDVPPADIAVEAPPAGAAT